MSSQAAKAFYDSADDEAKEWLAKALFYRELETIKRDAPLLDPTEFRIKKVEVYDDNAARPGQVGLRGGAAPDRPSSPLLKRGRSFASQLPWYLTRLLAKAGQVIDLLDSDDDAPAAKRQPPGPLTDMRIDIPKLTKAMGYAGTLERQFPLEVEAARADFLSTGYEYMDQETMLNGPDWLHYLRTYDKQGNLVLLYKGFPMVEDVVFIKHPNHWPWYLTGVKTVESGQCYWLAVALLIYGNASFWVRVKAEHLSFLEKVLSNPEHPRHQFYTRLNQSDSRTTATGPRSSSLQPETMFDGDANLWERLQIPGCWTNEDTCILTADVYGVFIVLYKYHSGEVPWWNKVYDMKTYGSYNSRHLFLCYTVWNHFQPMVPNDYYAYEFKLPRPTLQSTKKYALVTSAKHRRRVGDGPDHYWRVGGRDIIPSPCSRPSFEPEHLGRAVGYGPYVNQSAAPQPQPAQQQDPAQQQAPAQQQDPPQQQAPAQQQAPEQQQAQAQASPDSGLPSSVARGIASMLSAPQAGARSPPQPSIITQADVHTVQNAVNILQQFVSGVTQAGSSTSLKRSAASPPDDGRPAKKRRRNTDPGARPGNLLGGDGNQLSSVQPSSVLRSSAAQQPNLAPPQPPPQQPPPQQRSPAQQQPQPPPAAAQQQPPPVIVISSSSSSSSPSSGTESDRWFDDTCWRPATKWLLMREPVKRLRSWCSDLKLARDDEELVWLKEMCADALVRAGVEVRVHPVPNNLGLSRTTIVNAYEEVHYYLDEGVIRLPGGREVEDSDEEDGKEDNEEDEEEADEDGDDKEGDGEGDEEGDGEGDEEGDGNGDGDGDGDGDGN
ncbi:uncharacterized protein THITE_2050349 [Thermothielavioides terrestris NRRL 8126]|uniref:Uncharacterized protein n=1 Tax=Thermothielavioides terrestris (strain ATCC 38088 / NRRL 8126) TaxID=578455 RepID=G2R6M6_THETT|nr:uncharacterized protein THITE_2050349 [Thermothielavioides terrestris NRRL 8126]AEO67658.1 hypothetical protein THITE_2050349 [Thermothielavioides terrestris NRRL 8126]